MKWGKYNGEQKRIRVNSLEDEVTAAGEEMAWLSSDACRARMPSGIRTGLEYWDTWLTSMRTGVGTHRVQSVALLGWPVLSKGARTAKDSSNDENTRPCPTTAVCEDGA